MNRKWLDYARLHFDSGDDHMLECDVADAKEIAAEIDKLREALRPFAESDFEKWQATEDCCIPTEAFRNAREVFKTTA